ncbi:MAG TPA: nuclear transport factor 2 family protein [Caulifigura sp.]|nr:nuclear transport factor 2 family protein [Caulifigura sp.]
MRKTLRVLAVALSLCGGRAALAQEATPPPDEAAIHKAAIAYVDAYNAKDAAAIAALFSDKARVETADGVVVEGAERIKAGFEEAFRNEPRALISLKMDSLTLLTPDVAIEQGSTEFFPDGETLTTRSKYLVAHLRQNGQWKMVSARSMGEELVSSYEHLRQLDFLLGDWIDEDPNSVVESSFRFESGKNFLIHEFSVRRGKSVVQTGTHRIGWDPQAKRIRGWIFDSQGGFGESSWEEVDGSWIVKSTGVSSEGASVSGTRTLTPDGERIRVRVTERVAQGQRAPDLDFTMVRRPPAPVSASAVPARKGGAQ